MWAPDGAPSGACSIADNEAKGKPQALTYALADLAMSP